MTLPDHENNPFGIQWQRYWENGLYPDLVKSLPHVDFEVDDLNAAIVGQKVLMHPNSPNAGLRVAFAEVKGAPVELVQYIAPEENQDRGWPGLSENLLLSLGAQRSNLLTCGIYEITSSRPAPRNGLHGVFTQSRSGADVSRAVFSRRSKNLVCTEERITMVKIWAQDADRVTTAGDTGSHARGEAGPDSDIDFCIDCFDPGSLLQDFSWIYTFGANARVGGSVENYNLLQAIVFSCEETEAESGIEDTAWMELPIDGETARVINKGLRIRYDPPGSLHKPVACAA